MIYNSARLAELELYLSISTCNGPGDLFLEPFYQRCLELESYFQGSAKITPNRIGHFYILWITHIVKVERISGN